MLLWALPLLALSATPRVELRPAPVLVVLKTAATPTQTKREERLHEEVSLLLDDFAVVSQPMEERTFATLPLPSQLEQVLAIARENDAVAALWLAEPSPGQLLVHVLGLSTGRALIRSLEFDRRTGAEKGLALIVRELLGTAFLQAPPETVDPSVARVVHEVRKALPADPLEPPPPQPVPASWALGASLVSGVSLAGAVGHWVNAGARLRGEWSGLAPVGLGLELEGRGARDGLAASSSVEALELSGGPTATLRLRAGHLVLGPRLSVVAGGARVSAHTAEGTSAAWVWVLRARAGFELSAGEGPVRLTLELDLDALPLRGGVRPPTTAPDLWRAPWLEATLAAGLRWEG